MILLLVNDPVARRNHIHFTLHDEHGVAVLNETNLGVVHAGTVEEVSVSGARFERGYCDPSLTQFMPEAMSESPKAFVAAFPLRAER